MYAYSKNRQTPPTPQAVVTAMVGLALLACVWFWIAIAEYEKTVIPSNYVRTTGVDTENDRYSGGIPPHWQYYPVIAFTATNGQTYTVNGNLSYARSPVFKAFDSIPIAYNPKDPQHTVKMLAGGNGERSSAIMGTVAGLLTLGLDLLIYKRCIAGGMWQRLTRKNVPVAAQTYRRSAKPRRARP